MAGQDERRSGYESLDHTADLALRVWAPGPRELLDQAAAGFIDLMLDPDTVSPERSQVIRASGAGPEELIVGWLNEILFAFDAEGLAPARATVEAMGEGEVTGWLYGQDFDPLRHEVRNVVKAVTFHDLTVKKLRDILEVTIVFDV